MLCLLRVRSHGQNYAKRHNSAGGKKPIHSSACAIESTAHHQTVNKQQMNVSRSSCHVTHVDAETRFTDNKSVCPNVNSVDLHASYIDADEFHVHLCADVLMKIFLCRKH